MHLPYSFRSSTWLVSLLIVATVLPLWAAAQHHTFLNDDTYITLTYAKNLAQGRGFVYNHAPPTLGTTTPLLTLIIAGLAALLPQVDVATIAVFFTAWCWIGTVWLVFFFKRSWALADWQAAIVGLVLIASGWVGFLGMEAYLFACLLLLVLSLFHAERYILAGTTTGLLFLTRGEGILVLLVVSAFSLLQMWLKGRCRPPRTITPLVCLTLSFHCLYLSGVSTRMSPLVAYCQIPLRQSKHRGKPALETAYPND